MLTRIHLQESPVFTCSCMHQHTWLHNEMPYFLCNLKKMLSLLSLWYVTCHTCACTCIHPTHTHTLTPVACFPPKQYASSAWKPRDGRRGAHLLQLDIFHGNRILMWASQKRHVWHTDPMAEIVQEQWPDKETGWGGWSLVFSGTSHVKLSQSDPEPCCIYFYFVSLSYFPLKLMAHDLDQQSTIITEEAEITDSWGLSPQTSESFIATFKVNCC